MATKSLVDANKHDDALSAAERARSVEAAAAAAARRDAAAAAADGKVRAVFALVITRTCVGGWASKI